MSTRVTEIPETEMIVMTALTGINVMTVTVLKTYQ